MGREPLSVVVTTFNSAGTLDACLRGVSWADEIVVLDSGSSDATTAIAAHYGARIHAQPFAGYSAQKQAAIDLASHRWVLLMLAPHALRAQNPERAPTVPPSQRRMRRTEAIAMNGKKGAQVV